jgi:hypothetical protein
VSAHNEDTKSALFAELDRPKRKMTALTRLTIFVSSFFPAVRWTVFSNCQMFPGTLSTTEIHRKLFMRFHPLMGG